MSLLGIKPSKVSRLVILQIWRNPIRAIGKEHPRASETNTGVLEELKLG